MIPNTNHKSQNTENKDVRVRFAPSPTGALHCGGVRTALYNYLFAKKLGGKLILRIEDTDSTRFVEKAEKYITESFNWLGIDFDESPEKGGNYGPYRQSERRDLYKEHAEFLVRSGHAYYAFDTNDELAKKRENISNFAYDWKHRNSMKNSLTLSKEETKRLLETRNDYTIRIKYPERPFDISFTDMIRGEINISTSTLDDKVIWKKKDNLPTYHLANVVDDHFMKISHVIRGEEWIPSTPLHVFLYMCLGWNIPQFAHLPLILGPKGKLSKRDGMKYGFPVFPLKWVEKKKNGEEVCEGYKSLGYLPESVINILAFLGWNPGNEKELYTLDELINDFDLSRVNNSGAKFNPEKALWFNNQHMTKKSDYELVNLLDNFLVENGKEHTNKTILINIIRTSRTRVNVLSDFLSVAEELMKKPEEFECKALKKWKKHSPTVIKDVVSELSNLMEWNSSNLESLYSKYIDEKGSSILKGKKIGNGDLMPQTRLLLTGKCKGASVFDIMEILGKKETIERMSCYDSVIS